MADLSGRAALITGAAQGIGKAIAEALLSKNVKVCLCDINVSEGELTEKTLQKQFGQENVIFLKLDVCDKQEFEDVVKAAKTHFGHLDILINNAGIINEDNWRKMVDVNFTAVAEGIYLAHKYLAGKDNKKGGVVINTSSITALTQSQWSFLPVYTSTKCAVIGLTLTWGHEHNVQNTNVKVNAICPDVTNTSMVESAKLLPEHGDAISTLVAEVGNAIFQPSAMASAVVKVLEDDVTGKALVISLKKGVYYYEFPTSA